MSILTNLLNRVRNLEARVAASKGDGAGVCWPMVEVVRGDGPDEEMTAWIASLEELEREHETTRTAH